MSHDHDEKDAKGELLPCPFCGNDSPRMFYRMDESVYSHAAVQYLRITCDECDCESIDSEDHNEVIAAWNARADTARVVAQAEVERLKAEVSRLKGFEKQVDALLAERRELLARQSENAEIIAIHDKLQAGRLGMHPLIAAMCQVAAGASMDEAMRDIGYVAARQVAINAAPPSPTAAD